MGTKKTAKKVVKTLTRAEKRKRAEKAIKRANAAFEKMSAAEKRVAIAKDVLSQLKTRKLLAKPGTWAMFKLPEKQSNKLEEAVNDINGDNLAATMQLDGVLKKIVSCDVCALGSLFVCAVKRADRLTVEQANIESSTDYNGQDAFETDETAVYKYLKRFFPPAQLRAMEMAFEQGLGIESAQTDKDHKIVEWGTDIADDNDRLVAIMKNVIENKGTFKPKLESSR